MNYHLYQQTWELVLYLIAHKKHHIKKLISTRENSGLSQLDVAKLMSTKQSVVARLESADGNPTLKPLSRYAEALGGHLQINIAR